MLNYFGFALVVAILLLFFLGMYKRIIEYFMRRFCLIFLFCLNVISTEIKWPQLQLPKENNTQFYHTFLTLLLLMLSFTIAVSQMPFIIFQLAKGILDNDISFCISSFGIILFYTILRRLNIKTLKGEIDNELNDKTIFKLILETFIKGF